MKLQKVYLDQLTPKTKEHTVKVKVLKKQRAQQNPGKTKFQCLLLQDEKGTKMQAVLFGVDIDIYSNIIYKGESYDIANPVLKEVDADYRYDGNDRQLQFSNLTSVSRLGDEASSSQPGSQYLSVADVPHNAVGDDRFGKFS